MFDPSWNSAMQRMGFGDAPNCAKCGLAMTPENSKHHPELFLHDACLPEQLRSKLSEAFVAAAETEAVTPITVGEHRAKLFRYETSQGDGKAEGTLESLLRAALMLDTYSKDLYPANEFGQVHFARAIMESAADEIKAYVENTRGKS